jgi:hypothetical protein
VWCAASDTKVSIETLGRSLVADLESRVEDAASVLALGLAYISAR